MACRDEDRRITVEVPNVGLEISPHTVDFRRERKKFDYFKANFNEDVGNHIQESTIEGELSGLQKAYVKIEGERVYPMIWKPAGVSFNQEGTSVELFDPIYDLQRALVDISANFTRARSVIQTIFDQYTARTTRGERIINNVRYYPEEIPVNQREALGFGSNQAEVLQENDVFDGSGIARGTVGFTADYAPAFLEDGYDIAAQTFKGKPPVDYDQITALQAFLDVLEKTGIEMWTQPTEAGSTELDLWVGRYDVDGIIHHATSDDQGVWKIRDFNISSPQKPIQTLIVEGKPVHDDLAPFENIVEWLNPKDKVHDYVAQVRMERDVPRGRTVSVDADVGIETLPIVAKTKFMEIMASETAGDIKISPDFSSTQVTDYKWATVGDKLKTHNPVGSSCSEKSQLFENEFIITGVENSISNGNWTINFDVVDSVLDEEIPEAELWYLDPYSEELHDPSDLESKLTDKT